MALAPRLGRGTGTFASPHAGWGFHRVTRRGWAQGTGTFLLRGCPQWHTGPPWPCPWEGRRARAVPVPCPRRCSLSPSPWHLCLPATRHQGIIPLLLALGTVTLWLLALGTAPQQG